MLKNYRLLPNVLCTIHKNKITFVKNIWNFAFVEITQEQFGHDYAYILQAIHKISQNEPLVWKDYNEQTQQVIYQLSNFQMVQEVVPVQPFTAYFCNKNTYQFLQQNGLLSDLLATATHYDLNSWEKSDQNAFTHENVLILYANDALNKLRSLNTFLVHNKSNYVAFLWENDFIHGLSYNATANNACFECYFARIITRMNTANYQMWQNFQNQIDPHGASAQTFTYANQTGYEQKTFHFLLSYVAMLLHNNQTYLQNLGFLKKMVKIYLPTMEVQYDHLLKMPFCAVCGAQNQLTTKENNLNLLKVMQQHYGE